MNLSSSVHLTSSDSQTDGCTWWGSKRKSMKEDSDDDAEVDEPKRKKAKSKGMGLPPPASKASVFDDRIIRMLAEGGVG